MAKKEIPQIKVDRRERLGSRYAARLRKEGRVPVVVYGHKREMIHASVDGERIDELVHQHVRLLEVLVGAEKEPCLIKDVQWNHLGNVIVHADLARVDLTEKVRVDVTLQFTGEAVGLKEAGTILETLHAEIEVECLATDIPEVIKADITHLKVDDALTVADLKLPEGVVSTLPPTTVLAAIHELKEEVVEVAPAEGASATEPEVIGKAEKEAKAAEEAAAAPGGDKAAKKE